MKRILYVLIAFFTFAGFQASAQQINVSIGSGTSNVGNTVFIPVEIQYPPGSVTLQAAQAAIQLTNPSVAEIVGVTDNTVYSVLNPVIASPDKLLFLTNGLNDAQDVEGLVLTLEIKLTAIGCSDVIFTGFSPTSPPEFIVDGVLYEDLATDFTISNGQVCGSTQCGVPPAGLNCHLVFDKNGGYQTLSWTPMSNVVTYEVEYAYNDPNCCAGVIGNQYRVITNVGNATSVNHSTNFQCFSFRVRAKCEDGTVSDWSDPICSCGPVTSGGPGLSKSFSPSETTVNQQLHMLAVPNPASDQVDISVSGSLSEMNTEEMELIIYDMSGKEAYISFINLDETKRVDLSSFNSGMYIVKIVDDGAVVSTKKLIVE